MKTYIFITLEGHTFQPGSDELEPDIENCQVIGFACGRDEEEAFENLVCENDYLLETTFDEIICMELKNSDYHKQAQHFSLGEFRVGKTVAG